MIQFIGITTVIREMYGDIPRGRRDTVRSKRPTKWRSKRWFLVTDKAASTPVGFGQLFLSKEQCAPLELSPHSPDLVEADCYLFP
jgi:hypothetical protein